MQDFTPAVAIIIKGMAQKLSNVITPLFVDWVPRMLIWSDPDQPHIIIFRMQCGDAAGKTYTAEGSIDTNTGTLFANPALESRVFENYKDGSEVFKNALWDFVMDIVDTVSFDIDAIAIDLGSKGSWTVKVMEVHKNQYCLGILGFTASAAYAWGFKGMKKVVKDSIPQWKGGSQNGK